MDCFSFSVRAKRGIVDVHNEKWWARCSCDFDKYQVSGLSTCGEGRDLVSVDSSSFPNIRHSPRAKGPIGKRRKAFETRMSSRYSSRYVFQVDIWFLDQEYIYFGLECGLQSCFVYVASFSGIELENFERAGFVGASIVLH